MADIELLHTQITERLGDAILHAQLAYGELTIEIAPEHVQEVCLILRDDPQFAFNLFVDVCGVDYLHYGLSEWETESATFSGFERGVDMSAMNHPPHTRPRFAAVYHLLSLTQNHRIRVRAFLDAQQPKVDSVVDIWPAANWFEREAFDLFGIEFKGHPDLRRILTDYGFIGHPFRKDFPLIGNVEARYDAASQRVVYEPVSIEPRILEPKVIRRDNRYQVGE